MSATGPRPLAPHAVGTIVRALYYNRVRNIGDIVAPLVLESVTGRSVGLSRDRRLPHIVSIGSLFAAVVPQSFVWGTGVMHPEYGVGVPDVDRILAIRGKLTHSALTRAGIAVKDVPLGDPGFLMPQLLARTRSTERERYRLGVVPHYVDRDHPIVDNLRSQEGVTVLDPRDPPEVYFEQMASCAAIVSTSLHGLVFAEALGLPNLWMEVSDRVAGQGFKFHDWFSLAAISQKAPFRPTEPVPLDALIARCEPREVKIDREALTAALSEEAIRACSDAAPTRFVSLAKSRRRPLPIFVISFNRGDYLRQVVASYRRQTRPVEIVVHDNGSDDPSTLEALADFEAEGVTVYRRAAITSAAELDQVDTTIRDFFSSWAEPSRYVVTDCDVDLSSAAPHALELYDELLDRFPRAACVGPMLRISDVPARFQLFNQMINRQIRLFWSHEPRWTRTTFGRIAYLEAKIDTTFALHRAGEPFRRLKTGLRIYHPFEARHLDWYIEERARSAYSTSSAPMISHWNSTANLEKHEKTPLRYDRYTIVVEDAGELRTRIVDIRSEHGL